MDIGELLASVVDNDVEAVLRALAAEPELARARDPALGSTALHFAVHRGFTRIAAALLDAGADPHARETASDATPLHWAAEGGHPQAVALLLGRGADLAAVDGWFGLTPLGWATIVDWAPRFREDRPAAAAALLAAGARHDIFTAVAAGLGETVRALRDADPDVLSHRLGFVLDEMEPLHLAVTRRASEMVELLVDLGADVRARSSWGLSPLALALRAGDAASAERLREAGAVDDDACAVVTDDPSGIAAGPAIGLLFAAARDGKTRALAALLDAGLAVDARVRTLVGELPALATPLQLAAESGRTEAVALLLARGADPNAGAADGLPTPLHMAAGGGHREMVLALLAAGADRNARERGFGATPRAWAEHGGHGELAEIVA